jgi:hypothetical protein
VLAYLFWHRPRDDRHDDYERRLVEFHAALQGAVVGSAAFRLEELPFAGGPGYEDWYLVEGWAALGELNEAAVSGARRSPHDAVAGVAGEGWGGVYGLLRGRAAAPEVVRWTSKPDRESYDSFLERERAETVWQRQLVLGPAPEFCLSAEGSSTRRRLWPR